MENEHLLRVATLLAEVARFYEQRKPFRVYHGSTNSTRILRFDQNAMVDVSAFRHILSIDKKRRTAIVEPNVPMDKLVKATLKHGLVPPVVMEFPGITVGGGLQGGAGESSSFKWGTFNRTLNWYDIVLADGRLVRASPTEHADLFWGGAGAYGTLGVVTRAEVQLIPAKRYVNLTYTPVHSFAQAVEVLAAATKQPNDFVDGILFAADNGVVITGKMSNEPKGPVRTFSHARDPWYYLHAERLAKRFVTSTEAVPLAEYLFRYDRGAFWMGKHAFTRLRTPFNAVTRRLLNPLLRTRKMYQALQASGVSQECIIQDIAMPRERSVEFLDFVDKSFGIYPLWLCPLLPETKSPLLFNAIKAKTVINVGIWGLYRTNRDQFVRANRKLEQTVHKLGGKKWLYAQSFYTEKEFWGIYSKTKYNALRTKYNAGTLPDLYQKVGKHSFTAISAKRGLLRSLLGLPTIHIRKNK